MFRYSIFTYIYIFTVYIQERYSFVLVTVADVIIVNARHLQPSTGISGLG